MVIWFGESLDLHTGWKAVNSVLYRTWKNQSHTNIMSQKA